MNQHRYGSNTARDDVHRKDEEGIAEGNKHSSNQNEKKILDHLSRWFIGEFILDDLNLLQCPFFYFPHGFT